MEEMDYNCVGLDEDEYDRSKSGDTSIKPDSKSSDGTWFKESNETDSSQKQSLLIPLSYGGSSSNAKDYEEIKNKHKEDESSKILDHEEVKEKWRSTKKEHNPKETIK